MIPCRKASARTPGWGTDGTRLRPLGAAGAQLQFGRGALAFGDGLAAPGDLEMDEGTVAAARQSRRRIIERPRLTRMLDASPARVRMLIAPAGYGKTTLARQWTGTEERPAVWYVGGPASADVAALAAGVARAGSELVPDCDKRIRERLKVTQRPEDEVDVLAEIVAEDLAGWPVGTWLVLDEYQFAAESPPSDEFVGRIVDLTSLNVLVASRTRPAWATARKILYGEILELGRNALAMSDEEARDALGERGTEAPGLVALADGWPAVIGLAAVADGQQLPDDLPSALYDFLAEELYQGLTERVQEGLCKLSLVASLPSTFADELLGDDAGSIIDQGCNRGILARTSAGDLELHPLLREFLQSKLRCLPGERTETLAAEVGSIFLKRGLWDEAFAVGASLGSATAVEGVFRAGLDATLNAGRSVSVRQWLDYAEREGLRRPILDVATAELALREGQFFRAETVAAGVARAVADDDPQLAFRAFCLAGRAAHLASREKHALEFYVQAKALGSSRSEVTTAAFGELSCSIELEADESSELLEELAAETQADPAAQLQLLGRRLTLESRSGKLQSVELGLAAADVIDRIDDPIVRSSLRNAVAHTAALSTHYDAATTIALRMLDDARTHRLKFAIPYARTILGMCHAGKCEFDPAEYEVVTAIGCAEENRDAYAAWNAKALLIRLKTARGEPDRAIDEVSGEPTGVTRSVAMEVAASRGLAEACCGRLDEALRRVATADGVTRAVEPVVLAACVRAIVSLSRGAESARRDARTALDVATSSGNLDSFVCAYRGFPHLAIELLADRESRQTAGELMARVGDQHILALAGHGVASGEERLQRLTPRELEVQSLLAQGLTNKDIAKRLFISESTVKVHVRHLFEKLGVRTRTAAALRSRPAGYAAPAIAALEPPRDS